MKNKLYENPFANNRLLNDILDPDMTSEKKRDIDVKTFMRYLSTPRTYSEAYKYLNMLLSGEHIRTVEEFDKKFEPKKIYVNQDKKTIAVVWQDGTSTVSKCHEDDEFDLSVGYALCFAKHFYKLSNHAYRDFVFKNYNDILVYHVDTLESDNKKESKNTKDIKNTKNVKNTKKVNKVNE